MNVKAGDEVLVLAGKDKGKSGKIKQALPKEGKVVVEGLNIIKRHTKARGPGQPGGIIEREAALPASRVQLICPNCRKIVRAGQRFLDETNNRGTPKKVRYCRKCDATIE